MHEMCVASKAQLVQLETPPRYSRFTAWCAQWDFGGLPWWLASSQVAGGGTLRYRSSDPTYLAHVGRWWRPLLAKIRPLLYENGGPVVMVQAPALPLVKGSAAGALGRHGRAGHTCVYRRTQDLNAVMDDIAWTHFRIQKALNGWCKQLRMLTDSAAGVKQVENEFGFYGPDETYSAQPFYARCLARQCSFQQRCL